MPMPPEGKYPQLRLYPHVGRAPINAMMSTMTRMVVSDIGWFFLSAPSLITAFFHPNGIERPRFRLR